MRSSHALPTFLVLELALQALCELFHTCLVSVGAVAGARMGKLPLGFGPMIEQNPQNK